MCIRDRRVTFNEQVEEISVDEGFRPRRMRIRPKIDESDSIVLDATHEPSQNASFDALNDGSLLDGCQRAPSRYRNDDDEEDVLEPMPRMPSLGDEALKGELTAKQRRYREWLRDQHGSFDLGDARKTSKQVRMR